MKSSKIPLGTQQPFHTNQLNLSVLLCRRAQQFPLHFIGLRKHHKALIRLWKKISSIYETHWVTSSTVQTSACRRSVTKAQDRTKRFLKYLEQLQACFQIQTENKKISPTWRSTFVKETACLADGPPMNLQQFVEIDTSTSEIPQ